MSPTALAAVASDSVSRPVVVRVLGSVPMVLPPGCPKALTLGGKVGPGRKQGLKATTMVSLMNVSETGSRCFRQKFHLRVLME